MYVECAAPAAGGVVWRKITDGEPFLVIPDGCLDVINVDGELLVAGPDTGAHLVEQPAGRAYTGIRFAPGVGPRVLGVPAHELRDQRVPLSAVWPASSVRRLADALAGSTTPAGVLATTAAEQLRRNGFDSMAWRIAAALRHGRSVADTADAVALSQRQLLRRCLDAFGYGPKTLVRVLRMQRAVALARTGATLATVAASAGYADQPHLTREVKALTGVGIREL